jgi:hypothetical protein
LNELGPATTFGTSRDTSASPLRSMARLWPVTLVLVAGGLTGGLAYAQQHPVAYTAEARLAVGGQTVAAQAVPGFALASQQLAADFARYVTPQQDQTELQKGLGARAAEVVSVAASPIPSSNVIRVEAVAHDRQTATDAAQLVAQSLLTQVNAADSSGKSADVLAEYKALSDKVAAAQSKSAEATAALTALEGSLTPAAAAGGPAKTFDPSGLSDADKARYVAAQQAAAKASAVLAGLQIQQTALGNKYQSLVVQATPATDLSFLQNAVISKDDRVSNQERFGLLGALAGLVLALLVAASVDRRRARKAARRAAGSDTPRDAMSLGTVRMPPAPPSDRDLQLRATSGNAAK